MKIGILHHTLGSLSGGCKKMLDIARTLTDHEIILYSSEKPNLRNWNYQFAFKWMQLPSVKYRRKDWCYPLLESMLKYMDWINDDMLISTFGHIIRKPKGRVFQYLYFPHIPSSWNWKYRIYRTPYNFLIKRTLKFTEKILVASNYVKRMTERFFKIKSEQLEVIYAPIDVDTFPPLGEKNDNLVVTIAAYSRWKHIEKVNEIARKCPQYQFLVIGRIGDPAYFEYLQSIKADNVSYHINLPNPIVKSILCEARYYLHVNYNYGKNYHAEHFGNCILEALAAGCTVLAHNSGGPVEILNNGKCGFLYDKHDDVPFLLGDYFMKPEISRERAKMYDFSKFKKRLRKVLFE